GIAILISSGVKELIYRMRHSNDNLDLDFTQLADLIRLEVEKQIFLPRYSFLPSSEKSFICAHDKYSDVYDMQISLDGKRLVAITNRGGNKIFIWDISTGSLVSSKSLNAVGMALANKPCNAKLLLYHSVQDDQPIDLWKAIDDIP